MQSHIVAELRDIDNEGLVKIIGRGHVETVVSHDIVGTLVASSVARECAQPHCLTRVLDGIKGRLMVKCARQPGLADAYEMFLGFEVQCTDTPQALQSSPML